MLHTFTLVLLQIMEAVAFELTSTATSILSWSTHGLFPWRLTFFLPHRGCSTCPACAFGPVGQPCWPAASCAGRAVTRRGEVAPLALREGTGVRCVTLLEVNAHVVMTRNGMVWA